MAIVDQFGQPYTYNPHFQRGAANGGYDRPFVPTRLQDIGKLIGSADRETIVAVSRLLMENWGPARAIGRQIPMYAVGRAWRPTLATSSQRVKVKAESVMRDQFCQMATLKGDDLVSLIYLMVHLLVRDGEYFVLLTEWQNGFPAVQIVPVHRIGQRTGDEFVKEGRYAGLRIRDGVIYNRRGTPVAYNFLADDPNDDEQISARSLIHRFDCDYPEADRGYPAISHGLNDGRDVLQSHEWERMNMLARSSHTMIEWNESGTPDDDPNRYFDSDGNATGSNSHADIATNTLFGGTWKTFRAGSGSKLQALLHETPGEVWESFANRNIRQICAGVPWPMSFVWEGHEKGGGTSERRDIMQARQTIEDVQCTVERDVKRIVGYAYQKLVKMGRVPATNDWYRWSFSKPPKLTVDDGRVSKAMLEMWRAGVVSDTDLLNDMGKDHDEYWQDKFTKAADKELMFNDIQQQKGVELDSRYKGMFTPNDMGDVEDAEEPEMEDTTNGPTDDPEQGGES